MAQARAAVEPPQDQARQQWPQLPGRQKELSFSTAIAYVSPKRPAVFQSEASGGEQSPLALLRQSSNPSTQLPCGTHRVLRHALS